MGRADGPRSVQSPAREALVLGVIDLVAEDLEDLLAQIDGMTVELDNDSVTLETAETRSIASRRTGATTS